ncbi:MAG: bifunctional phosphoribosylaminoimidazolecarboxamide formyltransferase/IMP cyclohydrolase, partial [Vicinamibacterales bacterium]|nr:bifunctional phosphoribosylaminoimidazolecarboxamide formyltransferase/IMP cyclohydrolase [Vicinamibacterales bacterium]
MRALISVSNKSGLAEFARGLVKRGIEIVSTGGTAKALGEAGLPVIQVADVTGAPEMMDGRVKTLHPFVHGGILARRGHAGDLEALARHGITPIDMVVVNLYPFRETAAKPSTTFEALIEDIDIGGPSMIRAAAKNFKDVLVVTSPSDYARVLAALDEPGGPSMAVRFGLARDAFAHTAAYDTAIANELEAVAVHGAECVRVSERDVLPSMLVVAATKHRTLRYGENPHQPAGWYVPADAAAADLPAVLQGKELSFTNLLDVDAAARIASEFAEPAAVVIKHTNPCGVATGASLGDAYVRARDADPLSAFGGIVGCNREIDEATA